MNARGTRRPHSTRPYKRPRKSKTPGKSGCAVLVFVLLAASVVASLIAEVVIA